MLTLDPLAEKLITSADNRFAAASKEILVRVESSANKLTIVFPRNVGNFFIGPSDALERSSAVSKILIASNLLRSAIERRCLIDGLHLRSEPHRRHLIQLNAL